jgi:hypothetical protein
MSDKSDAILRNMTAEELIRVVETTYSTSALERVLVDALKKATDHRSEKVDLNNNPCYNVSYSMTAMVSQLYYLEHDLYTVHQADELDIDLECFKEVSNILTQAQNKVINATLRYGKRKEQRAVKLSPQFRW